MSNCKIYSNKPTTLQENFDAMDKFKGFLWAILGIIIVAGIIGLAVSIPKLIG